MSTGTSSTSFWRLRNCHDPDLYPPTPSKTRRFPLSSAISPIWNALKSPFRSPHGLPVHSSADSDVIMREPSPIHVDSSDTNLDDNPKDANGNTL